MLVQTKGKLGTRSDELIDGGVSVNEAGEYLGLHSPDSLTNQGVEHVKINDVPIDALGTLEALAFALGTDPAETASEFDTWLLVNRTEEVIVIPNPHTTGTRTYAGELSRSADLSDHNSVTFLSIRPL